MPDRSDPLRPELEELPLFGASGVRIDPLRPEFEELPLFGASEVLPCSGAGLALPVFIVLEISCMP